MVSFSGFLFGYALHAQLKVNEQWTSKVQSRVDLVGAVVNRLPDALLAR